MVRKCTVDLKTCSKQRVAEMHKAYLYLQEAGLI